MSACQLFFCRHREGKVKCRTCALLTFNPDTPAVTLHSKTTESQTDPKPTRFVRAAQARELVKDSILIGGRNARAIILHPHVHPIALLPCTRFEFAIRRREFACILH